MKKALRYASALLIALIITLSCKVTAAVPPRICIDSPANGSYITNSVTIKGWSINKSGVKSVTVYINGSKAGDAAVGLARDDVNKAYNSSGSYLNAKYSGFSFTLDTSSYKDGTYTLKVISTGNDGTTVSASSKFNRVSSKIHIDCPDKSGLSISSDLKITGWSLSVSGVKTVAVAIDGTTVGSAQTGISRADVNSAYNSSGCYKGAAQSGFSYQVKYSSLSIGAHTVAVTSYGNDGGSVSSTFTVNVTEPAPIARIETPKLNNAYLKDTLTVKGWSVSAGGVKSVEVYIDGKDVGSAAVGISRSDVNKAINSENKYKDAENSGYSLTLSNLTSYAVGEHTVKIVSTGNNGDTASYETKVNKETQIMGLDSTEIKASGDFTISGWALNATGISKVELYYGTSLLCTATLGFDSSEIMTTYDEDGKKYKDPSKSGFELNVDISKLTSSTNEVVVKATGSDGETTAVSATVNVVSASSLGCIDTPASGENYTYNDASIVVSGWTLNVSGVKSISVYLDDSQITDVTTGLASGSGVLNVSGGKYEGDENARFKTGSIDISGLSYDEHTVKVVAVGNNGGSYEFSTTFNKSSTSFTKYDITVAEMATDNSASESIIDPDVIQSTDAAGIYEFMTLNYVDGVTADELNKMLDGCGVLEGKGQVFLDAAKANDINPVYLVAHARVESGSGTSKLSAGVEVSAGTYTYSGESKTVAAGTYYNQFGIKAVDSDPIAEGSKFAAYSGWNSVDASIKGGAEWIAEIYIWGGSPNQDTIYKMRFDPGYWDGTYKRRYQYATSKTWAHSIASIIEKYNDVFNGTQLTFDIPKYNSAS